MTESDHQGPLFFEINHLIAIQRWIRTGHWEILQSQKRITFLSLGVIAISFTDIGFIEEGKYIFTMWGDLTNDTDMIRVSVFVDVLITHKLIGGNIPLQRKRNVNKFIWRLICGKGDILTFPRWLRIIQMFSYDSKLAAHISDCLHRTVHVGDGTYKLH